MHLPTSQVTDTDNGSNILSAILLDAFCTPSYFVPDQLAFFPVLIQLLDIARCAKESEAAVLRAAYERRASQRSRAKELGDTGDATTGNELWRVPPPPVINGFEGEGGASSPKALQRVDVGALAVLCAGGSKGRRSGPHSAKYSRSLLSLCSVRHSLLCTTTTQCQSL